MIAHDPEDLWGILFTSVESSSHSPSSLLPSFPDLMSHDSLSVSLYSELLDLQQVARASHILHHSILLIVLAVPSAWDFPPWCTSDDHMTGRLSLTIENRSLPLLAITGPFTSFLPGYNRSVLGMSCLTAPLEGSHGNKDWKGHRATVPGTKQALNTCYINKSMNQWLEVSCIPSAWQVLCWAVESQLKAKFYTWYLKAWIFKCQG